MNSLIFFLKRKLLSTFKEFERRTFIIAKGKNYMNWKENRLDGMK